MTEWVQKNLLALLGMLAAAYGGFITGTTTTENRLLNLEARVAAAEAREKEQAPITQCMARTLERLTDKAGEPSPCSIWGM